MWKLSSWLLTEQGGVWPKADMFFLLVPKIIYLSVKVFLWISLSKNVRDQSDQSNSLKIGDFVGISPSFTLFRNLYKARKILGFSKPTLLKISVPKYGYRVYCPISVSKDDFLSMTRAEEEIIQHFQPRKGDIVVDIGAHIGRYTVIASNRVGPRGKVIAIEANPDNFEMLNCNIKLNQLSNVICLNYAVYSQETKIKLYLAGEQSGHTIYNTLISERASNEKFVEINANTLVNLLRLQGISEVNWIKIDVEGAEFEVLKGATSILSQSNNISVLIEVHKLSGGTTLYKPIIEFLSMYNFKIDFEKTYYSGEKHLIARKQH